MREIEIKLRVPDTTALEAELQKRGCALSEPIGQQDVIYTLRGETSVWEPASSVGAGRVVLRIRRDPKGAIFTLKQQRTAELDNIECETRIEDGDAMHRALVIMGFVPVVEVKKVRRKGRLGEYEICLDRVEELGGFVELEKMAPDDADAAAIAETLYKEMESLGIPRANDEKRGYDTQIYQLKHHA